MGGGLRWRSVSESKSRRPADRSDMRLTCILVLWLCACAVADAAHLKAKAKLVARLAGKHKRGVLSAVPPYKLGYDIPVVTHSLVKPLVVSYPPTAAVTAVKVPLPHPLAGKYPVPVGHRVPVPHPHYGLKFPHHTKTVLFPKPDHHFHHHHHHVEPKPVVPVVPAPVPVPATPVVPVGAPTAAIAHPVPGPPPPQVLLQPAPVPAPVLPAPPVHILPPEHLQLRPLLPAAPAPAPLLQYAHQFPYILRPGNAVQTSFFATYPRFPLLNYQSPLIPLPQAATAQVLLNRPQVHPFHLLPQPVGQEGVVFEQHGGPVPVEPTTLLHPTGEVPQNAVHLQPTQPTLHLQPAQPGVHLHPDVHFQNVQPDVHLHAQPSILQPDVHLHAQPGVLQSDVHFHGQPGVLQPDVHLHAQPGALQPDVHLHGQPGVLQPDIHLQGQPGGVLQTDVHYQGQPDIHLHSAQPGVYQSGQPDVHLQPGVLPTQPTLQLQPTPTVPQVDHDGWSPVQTQPQDYAGSQQGNFGQGQFGNDGQFAQGGQFGHDGQFAQGGQFGQDGQFTQGGQFSQDGQFTQGGQFGHDGQFTNNGQHQFTQEQGTQVYEQHSGNEQYDYQNQLQIQQHIQQQIEQAQYEQRLNNQHQPSQEYGVPQNQDFSHQEQDFSQHGRDLTQGGHNFGQQGQDFFQQDQNFNGQPAQEYGVPQGAEGRSAEGEEDSQLYHNHIPLGLQPPINRPLEHFR